MLESKFYIEFFSFFHFYQYKAIDNPFNFLLSDNILITLDFSCIFIFFFIFYEG